MTGPGRKERKVVTVLFADLVGFTGRAESLDPEDVEAILGPYHARLRTELERFGGTVEKFIGDAVMAVFGAPIAREDDPERAVRAALAIRDWAVEDGALEVRIAVNTGEALVSLDARPEAGEGMVAGDVVNTAARLQSSAPVNGILVGESTHRATRSLIDYREAEPVQAKGKLEPVAVWEAVDARSRYGVDVRQEVRAPLVGRQRELAVVIDALARAREEAAPQLVTLVGVPGIGKSRLVYELFEAVDRDPELIFWRQGRCLPYGDGVAYWALAEMVKAHAGILDGDGADETVAKLRRVVHEVSSGEDEARWIERHLHPLVGLSTGAEVASERGEAFAAWRRFFEALAEASPLVLVFEDLHWADEGLLDFVDELVEWASGVPLLAVCTARPELLAARPGWGGGKPNAATISLSPLSDEETARLVHSLLGRAVLPADEQRELVERAGGNPLYAEEFARLLGERPGIGELAVPVTLQGLIAARLDALAPDEKALLQDASVVGKVFWLGGVCGLAGVDRDEGERLVHGLARKEFVRRERRSSLAGESEYAFRHLLVRDVAYGQIPRAARADKHRRAAEWIESLAPDRAEDKAEMLAHHYLQALEYASAAGLDTAGLHDAARLSLREAGDRASALNAHGSALRLYERALELWPGDDAERPLLLFRRVRAAFMSEGASEHAAEEARSALLAAGERGLAAEVDSMRSLDLWTQGDRDGALELLDRASALVEEGGATSSRAEVVAMRARFLMLAAKNEEAAEAGREAIALAEASGDEELRANALNTVGIARIHLGEVEAGLTDLEESVSVTERLGSLEIVRAYGNLASVLAELGELRRSAELHRRGMRAAERFGAREPLTWMIAEEGYDWYWSGEWQRALERVDASLASYETAYFMEVQCRVVRGLIALARGDTRSASADADRAVDFLGASRTEEPQLLYPASAFAARAAAEAGDSSRAKQLVETIIGAWRDSRAPYLAGDWVTNLVVVLRLLGAGARFEEIREIAGVQTRWLDAGAAYVGGDYRAAADIYAEITALPCEAEARLRAAEALASEGRRAEADEQLARALAFWRSVGATRYVREGEALLAATA